MSKAPRAHTQEVRDFLLANPEFFCQHPDLLETLKVPHDTEGASLIEYQVSVLQDKNRALSRKLHRYHRVASDNEALLQRLHSFHLALLRSHELADLLQVLQRLRLDFGCNDVVVAVFRELDETATPLITISKEPFADWLQAPKPICGRLQRRKLDALFGDAADSVRSAAIAPLDHSADLGVLALCSSDEHKFQPGMGTLFLTILGQMLGQCLAQRLAERARVA